MTTTGTERQDTHPAATLTEDGAGAPGPGQQARAEARVAELDKRLGDPTDNANELSYARLVEADEAGALPADGERALDELGLGADFVPHAEGGRLERLDTLVRIMRQVFRRDVALGLGYGVTSFMAGVNVWTAGDAAQRARLARILTGGGKVSVAYHELAHGNDFLRNEFEARPAADGGHLLNGSKQVINNADRAEAWVLFSRTSSAPGSRSHSVLFVERDGLDPDTWQTLPRYDTVGVRGCQLSGLRFDETPVPGSALVGEPGSGVETALRAFQITRAALPGMAVGTADTALRTVVRFALGRRLYRTSVMDIPHARATLSEAFTDLLVCDSLSLAATRAVHLLPEQTGVVAAATKYLVPKLLTEVMHDLSVVLGARFYLREGEHSIFQKHFRDLPVLSLGHAGSAACQATIIPQLSRLARRAWFSDDAAPTDLFAPRAELPDLPFDRLTLAGGRDQLIATLVAALDEPACAAPEEGAVRELVGHLVDELRQVQEAGRTLTPENRTALAGPAAFALADRYAVLLAAAAAVGVRQRASRDGGDAFLADPAWLTAALHRLVRRLGRRPAALPASVDARVHEEVLRRFHARTSYDLYATPLTG